MTKAPDIQEIGIGNLELLLDWRMRVLREVFADSTEVDWDQLRQANREYYLDQIPRGGHVPAMAYVDGNPVACGALCLQQEMPSPDNPAGKCAYLMNIYVQPQYREQGIGHQIVQWLVDCALERGAGKIYLESSACARHMYAEMGFRPMPDMYHLQDISYADQKNYN